MAVQTEIPPAPPSAQVVGNAFVEQYYHILHESPELVYRFYQESSVLSRTEPDGVMTSVTTMKGRCNMKMPVETWVDGINDKICSLDYKNYKAEIKTADAQDSFKDGVIVLVTGCLTGKDNLRRKFAQSFFLAPQDNGYFVLNDVFRYVEENDPMGTSAVTISRIDDTPSVSLTSEPEPSHVFDSPVLDQEKSHVVELENIEEKTDDSVDNENQSVNGKAAVDPEPQSNENHISAVLESASSKAQEDAPKKSYAFIVSSQTKKGNAVAVKVYVPTKTSRVAPTKSGKRSVSSTSQDPEAAMSVPNVPSSINGPENSNVQNEGDGHSIYIKNLPINVTAAQLEEEFKKFGPIKQGGVQVRSNKLQGFCFGFVEFQDLNSMNNALQASPITIGDRQAGVEIKRTTTRVGSSHGRFPYGWGGFRNDSFRGRGNFSGGRSYGRNDFGGRGDFGNYGRNDFGGRGDFSGRGRGPGGRSGEGYQQGRGRGGRLSGPSQNALSP